MWISKLCSRRTQFDRISSVSARSCMVSHTFSPTVKSGLSLMKLMGLQKRLLTPGFNYQMFKSSTELMRALLITHEGERDYCGLSDDTRDCEVTTFIGGIKVCLMLLMLINCIIEVKRGSGLSDRPRETNINSSARLYQLLTKL